MDGWKTPVIIEPAVAPIIYADAVIIEVKSDVVWAHYLTRHDMEDGTQELHRQAIVVLTAASFGEAVKAANIAVARGPNGHKERSQPATSQ